MVYDVHRAVKIPVLGIGGIRDAEDVLEFLAAGARAVEVGTATFADPFVIPKILADLPRLLEEGGFSKVEDAVGTLR
jgi:dihydroorotate dehydrogenase (NAD+) catalytic subunit